MKELTAEEMQILSSIGSEIQQIMSMAGGGGQAGAPVASAGGGPGAVQMEEESQDRDTAPGGSKVVGPIHRPGSPEPSRVEGEEEEDMDEETRAYENPKKIVKVKMPDGSIKKAIIVGDPDASTGSGRAEERIEDNPEWDEDNLDEVVKGIIRMAVGRGIKKSQPINPLTAAIQQIAKAMGSLAQNQAVHERVLTDILEGLNVGKGLDEEQTRVSKERRPAGVLPADQQNVVTEFLKAISAVSKGQGNVNSVGASDEAGLSPAERVRKNMSDITLALAANAGELWQQ